MTPTDAIALHNAAYEKRDAGPFLAAMALGGLYEMPLLRSRMVGRAEIATGLNLAFAATGACSMTVSRCRESGGTALAEGVMTVALHHEGRRAEIPFAMVAQVADGAVQRLSVYLDARPYRLWADGSVMAMAGRNGTTGG